MVEIRYLEETCAQVREAIDDSLRTHEVAILPPLDVSDSLRLVKYIGLDVRTTILDPWYNKGVGGQRDDYREYIVGLIRLAALVSDHIFLWGFPEIIAYFVDHLPDPLTLIAWLTWYYKNNPSVIRGWRSSQNACLHLGRPGASLYPEHFLNEAQKQKQREGKLRYIPGPTSVIEAPLLVGFVGREEQTGHPAQKPVTVFEPLIRMTTREGEVVFDPMSGSGTTGQAARETSRFAILSDHSEEYTAIAENRLRMPRLQMPESFPVLLEELKSQESRL